MSSRKAKDLNWLTKKYMSFFKKFGMNEQNIIDHYYTWSAKGSMNILDYLWYIFNHLLDANLQQSTDRIKFYERNELIYSEMINFRRSVEKKNGNEIQKLLNLNRVNLALENLTSELEYEFTIIAPNDCVESAELRMKKISIEDAIRNDAIPYEKCSRKNGCVCLISLTAKRDSSGNLIFK